MDNCRISMKALVKNLGDQLNVPIEDLENLNIDKFVDDAIKVEAGELSTLRVSKRVKHVSGRPLNVGNVFKIITIRSILFIGSCLWSYSVCGISISF